MVLTRSKAAINYKELSDDELEERSMRGNGALKEESQCECGVCPNRSYNDLMIHIILYVYGS